MKIETLKNWKIKSKINFITVFAPFSFLLLYFLYIMPIVEKNYLGEKRQEIKNVVETAYGVIETFHSKFKKGEITEEEAKNKSKEILTNLRFETNNYFWMIDYNGIMQIHPIKPELVGTYCLNNKDSEGKLLFDESLKIAKSKGAGYVSYMWTKPGKTGNFPKESYVKGFNKWGWVIGGGIYIDDVEEELSAITRDVLIIVVVLSLLILMVGFYISKLLTGPVERLTQASSKVAQGDTDIHLINENQDEIGILTRNFNDMVEKIKIQLDYLQSLAVPVFIIDKEFTIQYINKIGAELAGNTQENIVGTKCYDNFKADDCNTEKCACAQAMKKDNQITEETVARPNGNRYDIQYTAGPIKDKNGNITGAIESIIDVSELKEMYNYLSRSTGTLLSAMTKFKDGDLRVAVTAEKQGDDIAKVFEGFNQSVENMRAMILKVRDAVEATASASAQISASTEEMAAGAQEQSAQTEEVATAVEEMASTVVETAKNANVAAEVSNKSGTGAKEGVQKVEETIEGMNNIADSTERTSNVIESLASKTEQIGKITQVIDEIADQTNLLALNAAIEAARAGEQGRGFAVVADEVRKLAERTTKATKEIGDTIKGIQIEAVEADHAMKESMNTVEEGKKLTSAIARQLNAIQEGAIQANEVISQVAAASEQQSTTAEQISANIEGITNVTNETAEGIQQVAITADDLNKLTNNLTEMVAMFKVNMEKKNQSAIEKNNNQTKLLR